MAKLSCTLDEFNKIIGPRIRNDVAIVTKQKKMDMNLICQKCNKKSDELDAAHKHGSSRKDIIEYVLEEYISEGGSYSIPNLQKCIDQIKEYHISNDIFLFLCKDCHREYDSWTRNLNPAESNKISDKPKQTTPVFGFDELPNEKTTSSYNGVDEILCENKTNSWRYKMGWTSDENRKNVSVQIYEAYEASDPLRCL